MHFSFLYFFSFVHISEFLYSTQISLPLAFRVRMFSKASMTTLTVCTWFWAKVQTRPKGQIFTGRFHAFLLSFSDDADDLSDHERSSAQPDGSFINGDGSAANDCLSPDGQSDSTLYSVNYVAVLWQMLYNPTAECDCKCVAWTKILITRKHMVNEAVKCLWYYFSPHLLWWRTSAQGSNLGKTLLTCISHLEMMFE